MAPEGAGIRAIPSHAADRYGDAPSASDAASAMPNAAGKIATQFRSSAGVAVVCANAAWARDCAGSNLQRYRTFSSFSPYVVAASCWFPGTLAMHRDSHETAVANRKPDSVRRRRIQYKSTAEAWKTLRLNNSQQYIEAG